MKIQGRNKPLWYLVNALLVLAFLLPFYWALNSSIKPRSEVIAYPPTFFPSKLSFENYSRLFTAGNGLFLLFIRNTFFIAFLSGLSVCGVSIFAGYALSQLQFPGINIFFIGILLIMMIPFQALLVPLYNLIYRMGLLNTYWGLIAVYTTFYMPFGVFMMRNGFDAIPGALREAALLDGASEIKVLLRVFMRLAWPAIITTFIYVFIGSWNDFLINLTLASSNNVKTIQVGLMEFASTRFYSDWGMINAGSVLAMLPVLLLFMFLQRYFIKGMLAGSIK